jgi:polyhydroxyalkanoate synthesis regulator phasin
MPKKKAPLSQKRQSEMFRKTAQEMIDAGELNPTDAEAAMDKLVRKASPLTRH